MSAPDKNAVELAELQGRQRGFNDGIAAGAAQMVREVGDSAWRLGWRHPIKAWHYRRTARAMATYYRNRFGSSPYRGSRLRYWGDES